MTIDPSSEALAKKYIVIKKCYARLPLMRQIVVRKMW